jgi:hypothetical protein
LKLNFSNISHLVLASTLTGLVYLLLTTSCANMGVGPTGGPKDSIPPTVLFTIPAHFETNFTGKQIEVTFDEYIALDNLTEKLVISPPLSKKPIIRAQGKSVILKFDEELTQNRTYSIDFKDGIKDYNEGNKLKELRIVFSTGNTIDTLQIQGTILDAYTLEPIPNIFALLYSNLSDTVFASQRPDFIAGSNSEGLFLFNNLAPETYQLFALTDNDKNLFYSNPKELIAFHDTLLKPSFNLTYQTDTIYSEPDTLNETNESVVPIIDTIITRSNIEYLPQPVVLFHFENEIYNQHISSSVRDIPECCLLVFNEPITDTFSVNLINNNDSLTNWNIIELTATNDSVMIWLTNPMLINNDTINLAITYPSNNLEGIQLFETDTIRFLYNPRKAKTANLSDKNDSTFKFVSNLVTQNFDYFKTIIIESPSPLESFNFETVTLNEVLNDSTTLPLSFKIIPAVESKRKFEISASLNPGKNYILTVDSALVKTFTNKTNETFTQKFSTQKGDFYGSLLLTLEGFIHPGKIMLLKNSKIEELVYEIYYDGTKNSADFLFLKPDKYLIKYYADMNNNRKWDSGKIEERRQPEPVYYFEKSISIKSNWEIKEHWLLKPELISTKKFITESE